MKSKKTTTNANMNHAKVECPYGMCKKDICTAIDTLDFEEVGPISEGICKHCCPITHRCI